MTTAINPSPTQIKNLKQFIQDWDNGDLRGCKATYTKARRLLTMFGDWVYNESPSDYSCLAGCVEWHNFHDRTDTPGKSKID